MSEGSNTTKPKKSLGVSGYTERLDTNVFRFRIKEILAYRGIKQKELADGIGISAANLSACLNGLNSIGIPKLIAIAKFLKIEFRDMFAPTGWFVDDRFSSANYCRERTVESCVIGKSVVTHISRPKAFEVSESKADAYISKQQIGKLCEVLECDEKKMWAVFDGEYDVTPEQWYKMCKILKGDAYIYMPSIRVSVDLIKNGDDITVLEINNDN